MKIVTRSQACKLSDVFCEMRKTEAHHKHEIIMDEFGDLRWKEDNEITALLKKVSLNDLIPVLMSLGFGKNSEQLRKLYRDIGYSIFGYWEIFYFEMNNPNYRDYSPPTIKNP